MILSLVLFAVGIGLILFAVYIKLNSKVNKQKLDDSNENNSIPDNLDYEILNFEFKKTGNSTTLILGDYVNFWINPDNNDIFIFSAGSIGAGGKVGLVPKKVEDKIRQYIKMDNSYIETKILSVNEDVIKVEAILYKERPISHYEIDLERNKQGRFIDTFDIPYFPRKPIEIIFNIIDKRKFNPDKKYTFSTLSKEYFIQNPLKLEISLLNEKNEIIAHQKNYASKLEKIIHASFFNNIEAEIIDTSNLKYTDYITVKLIFTKK